MFASGGIGASGGLQGLFTGPTPLGGLADRAWKKLLDEFDRWLKELDDELKADLAEAAGPPVRGGERFPVNPFNELENQIMAKQRQFKDPRAKEALFNYFLVVGYPTKEETADVVLCQWDAYDLPMVMWRRMVLERDAEDEAAAKQGGRSEEEQREVDAKRAAEDQALDEARREIERTLPRSDPRRI